MKRNDSRLRTLAEDLKNGEKSAEEVCRQSLVGAQTSDSIFTNIDDGVVESARQIDQQRNAGKALPALSGIPVAIKDLFNVRGQTTLAGSRVLQKRARPAENDADVIAPLRHSGLLFLGRTNMSEFAFSGMGLNPHYGTPKSVWDRTTGRLPGGSSSGSGVVVGEEIVCAAMGSDTAGSCRIPAAFNGVTGVKPSYGRLSLNGIYPLSPTSDAPGPLASDVDSCFLVDQLISGQWNGQGLLPDIQTLAPESVTLLVPESRVFDDLDPQVETAFNNAVERLVFAGVSIIRQPLPVLDECLDFFVNSPVVLYEAWTHHKELLASHGEEYDSFVSQRISGGKSLTAEDQQKRYQHKKSLIDRFNKRFNESKVQAVIYPTVACVPPKISDCNEFESARQINLKCLRNTATANNFDGCSISIPCHQSGQAPVGFMISARNGDDEIVYQVAKAIEAVLGR